MVDSGQTTELSHYLRLAGIQAEVTKVLDGDPAYFDIQKTDAGAYTIEAGKAYPVLVPKFLGGVMELEPLRDLFGLCGDGKAAPARQGDAVSYTHLDVYKRQA